MVAVIGDIHGCFYTLLNLFNQIKLKYGNISIYAVGDLVDRGKFSFEVINFIIQEKIFFTPGNHDYMFLHGLSGINSSLNLSWIYNGREDTIDSYIGKEEFIPEHLNLIKSAPLCYNLEDCFISHAGISNFFKERFVAKKRWSELNHLIEENKFSDHGVLWTRDELLNIGKLQIVGHTKQDNVKYIEDSNALYIDTGCCIGGGLTSVIVNKNRIIDVIQMPTQSIDIE